MDFSHKSVDSSTIIEPASSHITPMNRNPSIDNEQDVFQCGKCKNKFSILIEFLNHKKEHASSAYVQNFPTELVVVNEPNVMDNSSFVESSNQIWLWNSDTMVHQGNEIEVATQPLTPKYYDSSPNKIIISYNETETVLNQNPKHNESLQLKYYDHKDILDHSSTVYCEKEKENSVKSFAVKEVEYVCEVCNNSFGKHSELLSHGRCHNGEKPFQCNICGRTFSQKSNLKKHVLSHRVWPDGLLTNLPCGSSLSFVCSFCSQSFSKYQHFKIHMKEHRHKKRYKCIQEKCRAMFDDVIDLMNHVKMKHPVVKYDCYLCNTTATSLHEISNHLATHTSSSKSESKFSCVYCHAVFKKRTHLSHHLDTANHNNKCEHCKKTYSRERDLRRHLRVKHDEIKHFKCDICLLSFGSKAYLSSHKLTHSKEKMFICSVCDVRFSRKDILSRHLKKHQPNKKIPCPFKAHLDCKMEFTRNDKLKLHIKSHVNKMKGRQKKRSAVKCNDQEEGKSTIEIIIVDMSEKHTNTN